MKESDFETVAKALDRLSRRAFEELHVSGNLEEKIEMSRLQNKVANMRRKFLKCVFEIENAEELAKRVEVCKECGNLK